MNKPITANSSASFICRKYSRIFFPRPENRQVASPAFLPLTSPPSQTMSESTKCLSSSRVISGPSTVLLCGCQVMNTRVLLFSYDSFSFPDQRETCCYAWHGTGPSHLLEMRPSLRHKAPGSLSQGSNHQEFLSPGSRSRRVVPWGDVSSWVKGAE